MPKFNINFAQNNNKQKNKRNKVSTGSDLGGFPAETIMISNAFMDAEKL